MKRMVMCAVVVTTCWWQAAFAGTKSPVVGSLFGKERSAKEDVVHFRNNDVLRGTVVNKTVSVNTPYGMLTIPLRKCAGLSFEGARANTEAIVTVNFNRFTGIITDRTIRFRIGTSGTEIRIRKEKVRHVLLKRAADEREFDDANAKTCLFLMTNGDLLTGMPNPARLTIATDYADVPVSFSEIRNVVMQGGDQSTAVLTKKNRDVMRGKLATEELTVQLDIGIAAEAVYKDKFSKMFVDDGNAQAVALFSGAAPLQGESDGAMFSSGGVGEDLVLTIPGPSKVQLKMKKIPAGTFVMGSSMGEKGRDGDEGPIHQVVISKSFYMGVYEVTQAQWEAVMGTYPSKFNGKPAHPVEQVSWEDCQKFVKKINGMGIGTFRLPTEAEWEYACRAGTKTVYSFGDEVAKLKEYGNYEDTPKWGDKSTAPVGSFKPNAWGLYDMHGNVYEWCNDWYGGYNMDKQTDPTGAAGGSYRVYRGGGWYYSSEFCRSASRHGLTPSYRYYCLGFRLVRAVQ